jgi:hypothetical protein
MLGTEYRLRVVALGSIVFRNEYETWPGSIAALLGENPRQIQFILPEDTRDLWGHLIIYIPFDEVAGYGAVMSLGEDGRPGGLGPDADLEVRFGADVISMISADSRSGPEPKAEKVE